MVGVWCSVCCLRGLLCDDWCLLFAQRWWLLSVCCLLWQLRVYWWLFVVVCYLLRMSICVLFVVGVCFDDAFDVSCVLFVVCCVMVVGCCLTVVC